MIKPTMIGALLGLMLLSLTPINAKSAAHTIDTDNVSAEFRGCDSANACRFRIDGSESIHVVRPKGVLLGANIDTNAVRDRLNALLSNMIHQHKRIELQDLKKLEDGSYAGRVEVNGLDIGADPILNEIMSNLRK